ncbi:MAG: lytic murein transglycosylase [Methylobacterium sp.]|nr:lytic murein transglycosylase [Methylobacterium sp.]MCA3601237.1 lytic murein transglycosylase [Methylobacterium sp.]MCA3606431.1 lytic murein transglycosylase [Methylobacterium sp.]MCA3610398.1 lytic murein transglycosylase [Methylobacterium sp.]MCA3617712.1 lytic murein transglycosylase [Methylobacterium sp.]
MRRIGLTRLAIAASLALAKPAIGMEQHPRPKKQAAADATPAAPDVQAFLASLWNEARQRGIRRETFQAALGNFTPDPAIIALTKKQSEFVQPIWSYLDNAISDSRLTRGRSAGERFAGELAAIERKYGVDRRIMLGIWGMETNFGSFTGEKDVFRSLATLALHRYRDDFFREELLVALKMLGDGLADRSAMRGSWAGAMGQTQFMPSSFMKYAVDHDGDGVRDLWENIPDALASTANYLASFGWQPGLPWGMEVNVPDGFNLGSVEGMREFSSWAAAGFTRANGSALPRNGKATLWYPAGIRGPAFLVTENYRVIKRYNSSDAYALAVAHLGDRIAGGGSFRAAWPRNDKRLSPAEVKELQRRLIALGHPLGKVDGRIGELSREAIRRQQTRLGLPADGYPTLALLQKLRQK